jgi:hypothetical protein
MLYAYHPTGQMLEGGQLEHAQHDESTLVYICRCLIEVKERVVIEVLNLLKIGIFDPLFHCGRYKLPLIFFLSFTIYNVTRMLGNCPLVRIMVIAARPIIVV